MPEEKIPAQKTWRLHWHSGTTEDVKGSTLGEAFANSHYGAHMLDLIHWIEPILIDTKEEEKCT